MLNRSLAAMAVVCFAAMSGLAAAGPITAGADHTVVVKPDGTVWTWGDSTYAQLGDGTLVSREVPSPITTISNVTAVAAGSWHTLALKSDGTVYAWGYNAYGQLGDNSTTTRKDPVLVSGLTNVIAIAAGEQHSVALTSDGRLWTWGKNTNGQLGDGTTTLSKVPVMLTGLTSMTAIGAGASHTLAVKDDGTVRAWGLNTNGQLGDGSTTQRTSPVTVTSVTGASAVAGGASHSVILKTDGTLRAMGLNSSGQIGDGGTTQRTSSVGVSSLTSVMALAVGQFSSYALKSDGSLWAWGHNGSGRLGDGTTTNRTSPTQLSSPTGAALVAAGTEHALAVTSTGVVWTWGSNDNGQLGDGTTISRWSPVAISGANYDWKVGTPVFSVATGGYTTEKTVVVTSATPDAVIHYTLDGVDPTESDPVVASGSSVTIDQTRTLKARAWKAAMPASELAASTYTLSVAALTLSPSPTTYTSAQTVSLSTSSPGATIRYTLDGSTPTESSALYTGPLTIATSTTVSAIGLRSGWTSSAVKVGAYTMNFGTLAAPTFSPAPGVYANDVTLTLSAMAGATVRYMTTGQTVTSSSPAYSVPLTLSSATTVNARAYHPDYTSSAQVSGAYTFVAATPTLSHISGTYAAGHVITASTETVGAVLRYTLNGATPTANDPIVPAGGIVAGNFTLQVAAWKTGYTSSAVTMATYTVTGTVTPPLVAAGDSHSLAIRGDGTFWGWGGNGSRQLGDGTTTTRTLPVLLNVSGGVFAAAGLFHSAGIRSDGALFGWGANSNGQLGDGTTTTPLAPIASPGLSAVVSLAGGGAHTLALRSDGTVSAWGRNSDGQLGDGTTTQRSTPVTVPGLSSISAVSARAQHSLAVRADGSVWSWGNNGSGQLGTGNKVSRHDAGQTGAFTTAIAVAAGGSHGLALLSDGTVQAWGRNMDGQVGDGSTATERLSPVAVSGLSTATAIAAGAAHSLALDATGTVWAWGSNGSGQLGDGTTTSRGAPVSLPGLPVMVRIAAGDYHSLAVDADGGVWAWGMNNSGQLGDGTTTNRLAPVQIAGAGMTWKIPAPMLSVASGVYSTEKSVVVTESDADAVLHYTTDGTNPDETASVITSGSSVAIAQTTTLKVRAWKPGAVASEITTGTYELKAVTPSPTPATGQYASAQTVTMSTTTTGATIRYTTDGAEPTAASSSYTGAITVSDVRTVKARAFKTGWTASDSVAASYVIYAGTVATPTISPGSGAFSSTPLVTLATTTPFATLRYTTDGSEPSGASATYTFPFLIDRTTTVKAKAFLAGWTPSASASATYTFEVANQTMLPTIVPAGGRFATQQTVSITGPAGATLRYTTTGADPTTDDALVPSTGLITVDRAQILKVRAWIAGQLPSHVQRADFVITGTIAAGGSHNLALAADGQVWAWGRGTEGQVGNGTLTPTIATPVSVLTGAVAVAAGRWHSLAVRADRTAWGWGDNGSGRLGDGTTTNRSAPVQVSGLTEVVAVAAGSAHSLALKADGTVWAFGDNGSGQLGDGTTMARTTPVRVAGLAGITSVAAGEDFSVAVQGDGAGGGYVWAWGANARGQLGDGSTTPRTMPVRVGTLTDAVDVAAGFQFGLARLADGTLRGWGANHTAQVGAGAGADRLIPVVVPPLAQLAGAAGGQGHGVAVDAQGRVWGWGFNENSQLSTPGLYGMPAVSSPQLFDDTAPSVAVSAGVWQTLLLRPDGSVSMVGDVGPGQSGPVRPIEGLSLVANTWLLADTDGDGLKNWQEYAAGTDPLRTDSNGNGLSDLVDVRRGSQSGNPDDDGDGVANAIESANDTDPFAADTDGDGVNDRLDDYPLDATRSQKPAPNPNDTTPPVITLTRPTNARSVGGGQ